MNQNLLRKIIIICFIAVPLLSSIISTIHLVDLFYLGNPSWISYTIAIAIEAGAIASFMTISVLSKINKTIVWSMFFILFLMQVIGNIYFSYDWISKRIIEDSHWIKNFREMLDFFISDEDEKSAKMILSILIGVPIPVISVFLLKSTTDYIGDDNIETHTETISEIPTVANSNSEEIIVEKKPENDEIHNIDDASYNKRAHPART